MKVTGLLALLVFQLLGEGLAQATGLGIPGPVFGLLLLFGALLLSERTAQTVEKTSRTLIGLLPLLLIVPSAGIFFLGASFASQWPAFAGAVILGTIIALAFAAALMKFLLGRS